MNIMHNGVDIGNLRLEYLEKVLAMLDRITTPGRLLTSGLGEDATGIRIEVCLSERACCCDVAGRTIYMLNCGNANDKGLVSGHPRLRREAIETDLSPSFELLKVYEGVYDMDLSGPTVRVVFALWYRQHIVHSSARKTFINSSMVVVWVSLFVVAGQACVTMEQGESRGAQLDNGF